ncbi:MAG: hypothetical protein WCI41_03205 [bacterium]
MKKNIKVVTIFIGCMLFRLLPLRAPNVEPIMASIMPISRKFGVLFTFLFGFLSIFLFDLITHFGSWTWIAGLTYGAIGAVSYLYFNKFQASRKNFVLFAIFATIIFDLITGVMFAPMFHETMLTAFMLQIPFTALHLAGNIGFALTLSPVLNMWLAKEYVAKTNSSLVGLKRV